MMPEKPNRLEDLKTPSRKSLVSEFWYFLMQNKKWWLLPILLLMGLMGLLVLLSGTGAAPFIYTLF
jgi:hypothetical protein